MLTEYNGPIQFEFPRTADVLQTQALLTPVEKGSLIERIKTLLEAKNAVLVAHYYTSDDVQRIADETGGCVSDSLEMARFGSQHVADTLVVAGVKFMGETAKILNPEKRILMPTLEANCSLDLGCPIDEFSAFCDEHPDHTVVVYANTSAAVKARADWVVTSGIALKLIQHLVDQGEKILWAPDKHLGSYIARETGADILLWDGSCIVHEEFKAHELVRLKEAHPDAAVLVHPESPAEVIELADVVGSTTQLISAVERLQNSTFIVATDNQIYYKMRQLRPDKIFIDAPTGGVGATCNSCAHCPWMAMNSLQQLAHCLENDTGEIDVPDSLQLQAVKPLKRMLDFSRSLDVNVFGTGTA